MDDLKFMSGQVGSKVGSEEWDRIYTSRHIAAFNRADGFMEFGNWKLVEVSGGSLPLLRAVYIFDVHSRDESRSKLKSKDMM